MGSSGSGNFSDYPGSARRQPVEGGAGGGGAAGGAALCDLVINAALEEVERCAFYQAHGLPAVGVAISVQTGRRITVLVNGTELGYLPTTYNYLMTCIEQGYSYQGTISVAMQRPIVRVSVNLVPVAP